MKKKLLTLLALLTTIVSGAWADDINYNLSSFSENPAGTYTYEFSSTAWKNKRILIEIPSSSATGSIDFKCGDSKSDRFQYIYKNNGTEKDETRKIVMTKNAYSGSPIVYTSSDIMTDGGKYYLVFQTGDDFKATGIQYTFSIEASAKATALWDFQNTNPTTIADVNFWQNTGSVVSTDASVSMYVDASVTSGKLAYVTNGDNHYAQINAGTILQVPVQSTSDNVKVVAYPGQYNYTVGGVAATANTTTHTATMKEVAQGYIEIVATSTAYIYSIELKQYDKADEPALMSLTANETTYYADELTWTESTSGTFSTTIYVAALPAAPTAVAYNGTLGSITYSAGVATIPVTLGETTATYEVTFSAANVINVVAGAGGSVSPEGEQAVENGDDLTMTATPNAGYVFENWTKASDGSWSSTTNPLTIENITESDTYTANFKQLYKVTYAAGDGSFGSTNKVTKTYDAGVDDQITLWEKNYYIGRNGFTVTGWNDGTTTYDLGETVTLTGNKTMTAVYTPNAAWLDNSQMQTIVTWAFSANPLIHVENADGYYVQQATVNGNVIDIPMYINSKKTDTGYANNGKFATSGNQVQARNTKLTIPAIKGMTVVCNAKANTTYIFRNFIKLGDNYPDGSTESDEATASATYTYTGENGTVDICFYTVNDIYLSSIVVTYPVTASAVDVNVAASGYTTYASSAALDFANAVDGDNNKTLKAYVVSAVSKDAVTLTEVTSAPANTGVVLKGNASTTYSIPVIASANAVGTNLLTAVVTATTVDYETVYVVSGGKFCLYQGTEIPAGKAYLAANLVPANASMLNFDFGSGTTAIDEVRSKMEEVRGDFYNLNGQRVAQPTKGLYIVNGRKVIMK